MFLQQAAPILSPETQHWYGSEEFLALPAQLRETEMLALKLESLAQSIPLVNPQPQQDFLRVPQQTRLCRNETLVLVESIFYSSGESCLQGCGDSTQEALQDVDDWDLMEVNPDCGLGDGNFPSPPPQVPHALIYSSLLF